MATRDFVRTRGLANVTAVTLRAGSLLRAAAQLRLLRAAAQFGLLTLISLAGAAAVERLRLPLPGNLAGLLLLLVLLSSGVIRPAQVELAGSFLLKHLAFFFIPFALGLMTQGALFAGSGAAFAASLVGGAVIGIAVAGATAQLVARRMEGPRA